MSKKARKTLIVEFDVTPLEDDQIAQLADEAAVQGEASDGQGGKHYRKGETEGHPEAPFIGSNVTKRAQKRVLAVEFDVTGFTKQEIGYLGSAVEVQAEDSDAALIMSKIVPHSGS